jgi:hypothetical protein
MQVEVKSELNVLAQEMIRLILYFDVFKHPLHKEELLMIYGQESRSEVEDLFESKQYYNLYVSNDYISSHANITEHIKKRKLKAHTAMTYWNKAEHYFKTIKKSPFVNTACVSGSLSKNNMDEKSDVDYFIIADANRVYTCKFFLILYKKIFLFNSRKFFCVNYIIDKLHLEIPDKNIFTATEIAYLVPLNNATQFQAFLDENSWYKNYYPKKNFNQLHLKDILHKPLLTLMIEAILKTKLGDKFEKFCQAKFLAHAQKKQNKLNKKEFDLNIRTNQHASKYHPLGYQWKVKDMFQNMIKDLNSKNKTKIPSQFSL